MDSFAELNSSFWKQGQFAVNFKHRVKENVEQIGYLQDMLSGPVDKYFDRIYFVVDDLLLEEGGKRLGLAIEELGADHLFFGSDFHTTTVTWIRPRPASRPGNFQRGYKHF
jgi:hypothetical protein